MSHLLAIAVGPVQEFIAAARRTRDLWFGSYLLSEVSKAVAKSVKEQGGTLIFPHPDTNLVSGDDKVNVANIILVELPTGDPKSVAKNAKDAAKVCWRKFAEDARSRAGNAIVDQIWNEQVKDIIEFYAAWVERTVGYSDDRKRVMRLLAGRKNLRDFVAAKGLDAGLPKSSLDGQRETVLLKGGSNDEPTALRLSDGEQLDVVGVVKRLGGGSKPYPSVARVAAETWLQGASKKKQEFAELKKVCGSVSGLNRVPGEMYDDFPYEGTIIYKDRHADLIKELKLNANALDGVKAALSALGGEPNPYLAVIVADGDSMGKKLSEFTKATEHREFSGKLASFAALAKQIVETHSGVLIYAGGDDVLAFAPVHNCLECARELRNQFYQTTGMTLSVGVAIGHFMENLEDLREYGLKAEKSAKGVDGKDALSVHLHKRGGAPIKLASPWNDKPDERIERFAELMNEGTIPTKLPYELRAMATLYESWSDEAAAKAAIAVDLPRLIAKKNSTSTEGVKQALKSYIDKITHARSLLNLAEELLAARQLAKAMKQAGGES